MRRFIIQVCIILSVSGGLGLVPAAVSAYSTRPFNYYEQQLKKNTKLGGYENVAKTGPVVTAAQIVNFLLQLLGAVAICLTVYAGMLWLFARGNEDEIEKAKDILAGSAVGLFVILASYSIMAYIFRSFLDITN